MKHEKQIDILFLTLFCICFASFIQKYFFGYEGDFEQLPMMFRALNNMFIPFDFFTNTASIFGPRHYLVAAVTALATEQNFSGVYFLFTLIPNVLLSLATGVFAMWLFDRSRLAALLSIVFVLTIDSTNLGNSGEIRASAPIPLHVAMPLLLTGVIGFIRGSVVVSILGFLFASFIHPLLAYGTFLLLAGSFFAARLFKYQATVPILRLTLGCLFVLVLSAYYFWYLPSVGASTIPDADFIHILAYFRHPHHYVPSQFLISDYLRTCCLLFTYFASIYIIGDWCPKVSAIRKPLILLASLLIIACISGFIFVEILPTRLFVMAQPFRFAYLIKWFTFLLYAGLIAHQSKATDNLTQRNFQHWITPAFLAVSILSPYTMALAVGVLLWMKSFNNRVVYKNISPFFFLLVILLFILGAIKVESQTSYYLLLLLIVYTVCQLRSLLASAGFVILSALSFHFFLNHLAEKVPFNLGSYFYSYRSTRHTLADYPYGQHTTVADFLRSRVPQDSILVVPPDAGWVRFLGEKAIVVDHKAFPFQDSAMLEWYTRMQDSYGPTDLLGSEAYNAMDTNYHNIKDARLTMLRNKYKVTHALLYKDTVSSMPVLFENNTYKIVEVRN